MNCPHCSQPLTAVGKFWVCPEHGPVQPAATVAPPPADKRVFLSYGRADALDFTLRLAHDLQTHGYFVWFDMEDIEKGGLFEVRIEQGIHRADVLAAVMTPASVREHSVCRDEVVYALNESKLVVPLKVHPDVQPTLLLARRNWIDFTAGYEQGLDVLLRFLAGDTQVLLPPRLPTVTGVAPLDFGPEIARYAVGFTGRAWLATAIAQWLGHAGPRALVIVGEPGIGKSAIAAWLCHTRPEVAASHFCTQRNTRSLDPYEFVASLVGQLHARLPGYAAAVETRDPARRRHSASDAFRELIVEPTRGLPAPAQQVLIVVDSLDEAWGQAGESVVDVLVRQAPDLPAWLRIVATTRPEAPILERIRILHVFELNANRPENRADVRAYIDERLPGGDAPPKHPAALAARLEELAAGNFLYARLVLDALADGSLAPADLGKLTAGLSHFYTLAFTKRFPDGDAYARNFAPLLRALAAAQGPLPLTLLIQVANEEAETVQRRLREIRSYLRVTGSGDLAAYAFFHKSLPDWLTDPDAAGEHWCAARKGHARLAEVLLPAWPSLDYARRHLITHLLAADRATDAADRLLDLPFLEAKTQAGLVFDLPGDFSTVETALPATDPRRRQLALLAEALRRDIHFIARHAVDYPQALFQCLWNHAWWYDCPEAAQHYEEGRSPGQQAGLGLYRLLEKWRAEKQQSFPGFSWLRSLRPPVNHLGSALKAVFRGHTDRVDCVAFSPDGKRLVSGSGDLTLKVWDVTTGQVTLTLQGHARSVTSVAFSPDGQRLVSGSRDNTLKVWDATTGQEKLTLKGHTQVVTSVAFSPDGRRLVSGSRDQSLKVWDTTTGRVTLTMQGHTDLVTSVAFSPDGQRLVSGSFDSTLKVWDATTGQLSLTLQGHSSWVTNVTFSPDGKRLVSSSRDQSLKVWDATTGQETLSLPGHTDYVTSVAFSPDGQRLVSGSFDGMLNLWDATLIQEILSLRGHTRAVVCVAFSPDGQRLVSGSRDQTVKVWDATTGQETLSLRGHTRAVVSVAFSPDGQRLVSGSWDTTAKVWDATTGQETLSLLGHTDLVTCVAYSPDGQRLVSGSRDQSLKVWDATTGQETLTLKGHTASVDSVAFSPDGQRLVSCSWDQTIRTWDTTCGAKLEEIHGLRDAASLAAGPSCFPWHALSRSLETRIVSSKSGIPVAWKSGIPVAWFPAFLEKIATHPSGRTWSGGVSNYLALFTLEGNPPDS